MRGEELLDRIIGQKLEDGRIQSLHIKNEIANLINVTFLKFDDNWIRIVSTDEITDISLEKDAIDKLGFSGDDSYKFVIEPIANHFPQFNDYVGKRLLSYKELVLKETESMSFGINLYFDNNRNWIIHNQDYPIDENQYFFENKIPNDLKEKKKVV